MDLSNLISKSIVLLPTYNEAENIEEIITNLLHEGFHVLVVDDNSPDGTAQLVRNLKVKNENKLFLINRNKKLGLGSAYRTGFKTAQNYGYKFFIEMDSDFSHDIKDLLNMLKFSKDFDLIIGSRYVNKGKILGWSKFRLLISRIANIYVRFLLNTNIKDNTSGFRIYSNEALNKIKYENTKSEGYSFQIEMTQRAIKNRISILEVPIIFRERRAGKSKMNKNIAIETFFLVLKLKFKINF